MSKRCEAAREGLTVKESVAGIAIAPVTDMAAAAGVLISAALQQKCPHVGHQVEGSGRWY